MPYQRYKRNAENFELNTMEPSFSLTFRHVTQHCYIKSFRKTQQAFTSPKIFMKTIIPPNNLDNESQRGTHPFFSHHHFELKSQTIAHKLSAFLEVVNQQKVKWALG